MTPKLVEVDCDRISVEGCSLSAENANRLRQIMPKYIPWLGAVEFHIHQGESFTVTFKPTDDFWKIAEGGVRKADEVVGKLLHYIGSSPKDTIVSFVNSARS